MTRRQVPAPGARRPAALFVSANGIGRGHLVRQIAVAARLSRRRPVFLTLSYAAGIVAAAGLPVQFVPHHALTGEDPTEWNEGLAREIEMMLDATGADTLVYDVNFVFDGVIAVLLRRPRLRAIWLRRAMWPESHAAYLGAGAHFRMIVEPRDLAEALDRGPTVAERSAVIRVPPVLRIGPAERLPRAAARAALQLCEGADVVMLDLLSTAIPAFADLRRRLLARLLAEPGLHVVELQPVDRPLEAAGKRHHLLRDDTAYRLSTAFDAAVTRCGYNTFHEMLLGSVPTVFVPNEAPDMDGQAIRSRWAEAAGCGAHLDLAADEHAVKAAVKRLLDPGWRNAITAACGTLGAGETNGAAAVAALVDA